MTHHVSESTEQVFDGVRDERARQDRDWPLGAGGFNTDKRLAILTEEIGEVARALCGNGDGGNLRDELIQVAAVAVRWVECLDAEAAFDAHVEADRGTTFDEWLKGFARELIEAQAAPNVPPMSPQWDNNATPPPPPVHIQTFQATPTPPPTFADERVPSRPGCWCSNTPGVLCQDCAYNIDRSEDHARINDAFRHIARVIGVDVPDA